LGKGERGERVVLRRRRRQKQRGAGGSAQKWARRGPDGVPARARAGGDQCDWRERKRRGRRTDGEEDAGGVRRLSLTNTNDKNSSVVRDQRLSALGRARGLFLSKGVGSKGVETREGGMGACEGVHAGASDPLRRTVRRARNLLAATTPLGASSRASRPAPRRRRPPPLFPPFFLSLSRERCSQSSRVAFTRPPIIKRDH
jgi:hypothetical protein